MPIPLPPLDELIEEYKKESSTVISKRYGVSRQRVNQVLSRHPDYEPYLYNKIRNRKIRKSYKNGDSIEDLVKKFDLKRATIRKILNDLVEPKSIGCSKCKTEPYARGVCCNCYMLWIRRGKPDVPAVRKERKNPGPKD